MKGLNNAFGYEIRSEEDFIDGIYFTKETIKPEKWNGGQTYGVENCVLADLKGNPIEDGDKSGMHMRAFKAGVRDNSTREEGTDSAGASDFGEVVEEEGFQPEDPMYFDYDTGEDLNGGHRELWAKGKGLLGYMQQGVIFMGTEEEKTEAREEFKIRSNWRPNKTYRREPTYNEVDTTVRRIVNMHVANTGECSEDYIKDLASRCGEGLKISDRRAIAAAIIREHLATGGIKSSEQYVSYDKRKWADSKGAGTGHFNSPLAQEDLWFTQVKEDVDSVTLYINCSKNDFRVYIRQLLEESEHCISLGKPLHLFVNFNVEGIKCDDEMWEQRKQFFTVELAKLERTVIKNAGQQVDDANRSRFAWNHKDCRHVTFPQITKTEKNKGIFMVSLKGLNRDFN
jgi:hypothetical protein